MCTISASQENSHSLCSQVSVYFQGFYCVQSSCILVNFSIFLAYFTKKRKQNLCMAYVVEVQQFTTDFTSCRIFASALNAVDFWSLLTIE